MPCVQAVGTWVDPLTAPSLPLFLTPQARDVYEEAIRTVMTVRDFTQVFDSYAQFEESMIAAKMETSSELGREEEGEQEEGFAGVGESWVLSGLGRGEMWVLGSVRGHQRGRLSRRCA